MDKINDYYPKQQEVVISKDRRCWWASTKLYREINDDKEYIYEFIYTDCDGNGYYKLLDIRKTKIVQLTKNEKVKMTSNISNENWVIHHPYLNIAFIHNGVELIEYTL